MARRMFSTQIVNSDPFLDMPASTQALYFHLGLHCDDDGFVYPKRVMRMLGSTDDDMRLLLAKKFLLEFESGIYVQKHWKVNNYIRSDRYRHTSHVDEKARLRIDKGGVYRLDTIGIPDGSISKEVGKKEEGDFSKEKGDANAKSIESIGEHLRKAGKLPKKHEA